MNRLSAIALVLSAAAVSTASFAQAAPAAPVAQASPVALVQTTGKTRAEVIAETEAARQRGELQAGHEWGIDIPPMPVARRQVQLAKTAQ